MTYTLSEPRNARDWFPVKQVLEDKIDSVTFSLVCDKELLAGSNGLLVDVREEGSDHILTWKTNYPMAYYLISFAVADYMDYSFYAPLSNENDSILVQNYLYDTEEVLTDWKEEIKPFLWMVAAFVVCFWLPVDWPRFKDAVGESLALTRWYAREHVLFCLLPAFFIAGAIASFVSQGAVMKISRITTQSVMPPSPSSVSGRRNEAEYPNRSLDIIPAGTFSQLIQQPAKNVL